jgi:phosphoribosyl 1,2-cyclic phosphodiesterase
MTSIIFLGTGGGRFATIYQIRSTGGIYISDGRNLNIDPGPGALTNMNRLGLDPARTDAVLVSHCHPDHYANAEVLVEGMTMGGIKSRGLLVGSLSVMKGIDRIGPAISGYHRSLPEDSLTVEPGDSFEIGDMEVRATRTKHTDPSGVGFRLSTSDGTISYVSDSELDQGVVSEHRDSRVLILSLTRPRSARVRFHLCTEDAIDFIKGCTPEIVLLTHMGAALINEGADLQARIIEEATGVRTLAAEDLMKVSVGKRIRASRP